jgi:hypothetical protein
MQSAFNAKAPGGKGAKFGGAKNDPREVIAASAESGMNIQTMGRLSVAALHPCAFVLKVFQSFSAGYGFVETLVLLLL